MKKSEIAEAVFAKLEQKPLAGLAGGEMRVAVTDLAALSLVPWFCDESVQWAIRVSQPSQPLKKGFLKKVNDSFITDRNGAVLIGVPGDGIEPSTFTLFPLAEALAQVVRPGMRLELATANLGMVKRDWETKAETDSDYGDQRYSGTINADGTWSITQSTPALSRDQLATALGCGRMVVSNGPWKVKDRGEAADILMGWMQSPASNISFMAVKRFTTFKQDQLVCSDAGMQRKLCGLGLGFFRQRLAGGLFHWVEAGTPRHPLQTYQDVVKSVLG